MSSFQNQDHAFSTGFIRHSGHRNRQAAPRPPGGHLDTLLSIQMKTATSVFLRKICFPELCFFDRFYKAFWPPGSPGRAQGRREGVWTHYSRSKWKPQLPRFWVREKRLSRYILRNFFRFAGGRKSFLKNFLKEFS